MSREIYRPLPLAIVFSAVALGCGGGGGSPPPEERATTDDRPNILIIVADDLGYNDIGPFGGEIETPSLDGLAAEGLTLTTFYVLPTCSPTRSALLTGTDNHTAGLGAMAEALTSNQIGAAGYEGYLNDRVVTFASLLRDSDYHTYMAGKWHLGHAPEHGPAAQGFESSFTMLDGGGSHWNDRRGLTPETAAMPYRDDGVAVETLPPNFFSSEYYTDRMIEYIDSGREDGRPFFAYLAYTAPHDPLHAPDELGRLGHETQCDHATAWRTSVVKAPSLLQGRHGRRSAWCRFACTRQVPPRVGFGRPSSLPDQALRPEGGVLRLRAWQTSLPLCSS